MASLVLSTDHFTEAYDTDIHTSGARLSAPWGFGCGSWDRDGHGGTDRGAEQSPSLRSVRYSGILTHEADLLSASDP